MRSGQRLVEGLGRPIEKTLSTLKYFFLSL